jgi:hypothetical protein
MLYWKTRVFSFVALAGLLGSCGFVGNEGWHIANDSFVAPLILSPDNDLVVDSKLKWAEVEMEKARDLSISEGSDSIIQNSQKVLSDLNDFKQIGIKALAWPTTTTGQQLTTSTDDVAKLDQEHAALSEMIIRQYKLVSQAKANLTAGLIQKPDFEKEQQALDQLNVASMENERSKIEINLLLTQSQLGQSSFYKGKSGNPLPRPELIIEEYQLSLINSQIMQTEAAMQIALAEKDRVTKELASIAILEQEVKSRPLFSAMSKNQDIAFAPYSALRDISVDDHIMDCIWGVFYCRDVGVMTNIIPGETILPDIFGSGQIRGQFITLDINKINHNKSMQSKTLRIRPKS